MERNLKLNQFDLNLLRTLDALLTERHVTRAAARLHVTQQAASSALHRLREHFDDALLVRHGRNLELTAQAEALIEPVRNALLAAQAALEARPSFDPATARGTLRIAMSDYGMFVALPHFMMLLTDLAPGVHCRAEALPHDGFDTLEMGELDLMLSARDVKLYGNHRPSADIRSRKIFEDDFVCVGDPRCIYFSKGLSSQDYLEARHNTVSFGPGLKSLVAWAWEAASVDLNVVAVAPSFSAQIFMLPGTPIIATAQRRLAEALAPRLNLQIVECPLEIPRLQERLMWHARSDNSPMVQFARDLFARVARELSRSSSRECDD
jgi:DNA-binding transcriptional LysR family regulator